MKTKIGNTSLALALVAFATACDTSPSEPEFLLEPPVAEALDAELELATDPELARLALESAEARVGRVASPHVRERLAAARGHFEEARRRYQAGQPDEARRRGRLAREAIADATLDGLGASALEGMIDEVEATIATLTVDGGGIDAPGPLLATLGSLVSEARADQARGARRDGAEKMVRARQHTDRHVRRHGDRPDPLFGRDDRVRLQVAMGGEGVELAVRLVGATPTETQVRLLDTAAELQRGAQAAFDAGEWGRAMTLSREAEITALRAVVDIDGVSDAEGQSIKDAAEELLAEAAVVVEAGGSAIDTALLQLAQRLYDTGVSQLQSGKIRGLALVWHAANAAGVILP